MTSKDSSSDTELVTLTRQGDREAFGRIVEKYQRLVCSLAYSSTGSFAASEDVAQETFLTAWKNIGGLRDPGAVRGWLCGIARNLASRQHRQAARFEPMPETEPASGAEAPSGQAMVREEERLVWAALEKLPESYREPLVLFYREQASVRRVAEELEISEDAARQRLARGRELIRNEVLGLVESALTRSRPGRAFTIGVLASLPAFAVSAKAAVIGGSAIKGSAAAKVAGLGSLAAALSGAAIGIVGGWLGVKMALEDAESETERREIARAAARGGLLAFLLVPALYALKVYGQPLIHSHPHAWGWALGGILVLWIAALLMLAFRTTARIRAIRSADRAARGNTSSPWKQHGVEYRSTRTFLGLPLVHIAMDPETKSPVARGWIAVGRIAVSPLLACGGVAIAPVAMGGAAIGVLGMGGIAFGLAAIGGIAAAVFAMGGLAAGYAASGGLAIGYHLAAGGYAISHEFAVGGKAFAAHANDAAARAAMSGSTIGNALEWLNTCVLFAPVLSLLPILLAKWQRNIQRKR